MADDAKQVKAQAEQAAVAKKKAEEESRSGWFSEIIHTIFGALMTFAGTATLLVGVISMIPGGAKMIDGLTGALDKMFGTDMIQTGYRTMVNEAYTRMGRELPKGFGSVIKNHLLQLRPEEAAKQLVDNGLSFTVADALTNNPEQFKAFLTLLEKNGVSFATRSGLAIDKMVTAKTVEAFLESDLSDAYKAGLLKALKSEITGKTSHDGQRELASSPAADAFLKALNDLANQDAKASGVEYSRLTELYLRHKNLKSIVQQKAGTSGGVSMTELATKYTALGGALAEIKEIENGEKEKALKEPAGKQETEQKQEAGADIIKGDGEKIAGDSRNTTENAPDAARSDVKAKAAKRESSETVLRSNVAGGRTSGTKVAPKVAVEKLEPSKSVKAARVNSSAVSAPTPKESAVQDAVGPILALANRLARGKDNPNAPHRDQLVHGIVGMKKAFEKGNGMKAISEALPSLLTNSLFKEPRMIAALSTAIGKLDVATLGKGSVGDKDLGQYKNYMTAAQQLLSKQSNLAIIRDVAHKIGPANMQSVLSQMTTGEVDYLSTLKLMVKHQSNLQPLTTMDISGVKDTKIKGKIEQAFEDIKNPAAAITRVGAAALSNLLPFNSATPAPEKSAASNLPPQAINPALQRPGAQTALG